MKKREAVKEAIEAWAASNTPETVLVRFLLAATYVDLPFA
jgi:hypothetical protein